MIRLFVVFSVVTCVIFLVLVMMLVAVALFVLVMMLVAMAFLVLVVVFVTMAFLVLVVVLVAVAFFVLVVVLVAVAFFVLVMMLVAVAFLVLVVVFVAMALLVLMVVLITMALLVLMMMLITVTFFVFVMFMFLVLSDRLLLDLCFFLFLLGSLSIWHRYLELFPFFVLARSRCSIILALAIKSFSLLQCQRHHCSWHARGSCDSEVGKSHRGIALTGRLILKVVRISPACILLAPLLCSC